MSILCWKLRFIWLVVVLWCVEVCCVVVYRVGDWLVIFECELIFVWFFFRYSYVFCIRCC